MVVSCPSLGLSYWPLLEPPCSRGGKMEGGAKWAEETTGGRMGAETQLTNGDILVLLSMANCLTANTTIPITTSLQQHSASAPLTHMTAETPQQPELMTLVSREIVCLLGPTPDPPVWLMHTHWQVSQMCMTMFTLVTHTQTQKPAWQ